jgi:DNA-binding IclR family transcriptional regulator
MQMQSSNKARIARRVIEVLEFFDDRHGEATVMDIVRRYDRPQSSTSELLSSLVELGILYKDPKNRSYRPTPRVAMLGGVAQAPIVRDGRLTELMDRLNAQTGLAVALFGLVGVDVQIFDTRSTRDLSRERISPRTYNGMREKLTGSAAGRLLLGTLSRTRREGIVRRLNAEAKGDCVPLPEMLDLIDACERQATAVGELGFGCHAEVCAALLPAYTVDEPMAVGFVYQPSNRIDVPSLTRTLTASVAQMVERADDHLPVKPLIAVA